MKWPFVGEVGAVSDFGEAQAVVDAVSGFRFMLPRYGVWQRRPSDGKLEVIYTTNDYDEAVRRASGGRPREEA